MGLYEGLLEEREEDERGGERLLGHFHGLDSPVLDGLLANAPEDRPKKYGADLYRLYRYVHHGVRSLGSGYRFRS